MNIKPLADRIVIKMVEAEETTKSGIILACLLYTSHTHCQGKDTDHNFPLQKQLSEAASASYKRSTLPLPIAFSFSCSSFIQLHFIRTWIATFLFMSADANQCAWCLPVKSTGVTINTWYTIRRFAIFTGVLTGKQNRAALRSVYRILNKVRENFDIPSGKLVIVQRDLQPVSYTHLDVYKRQTCSCKSRKTASRWR